MRCLAPLFIVTMLFATALAEPPGETESHPDTAKKPSSYWMEKKMQYAQEMLRGLAMNDFESIGENARQMRLLSKVEGFVRRRNPRYRTHRHTFERVCDEMIRQSDKQDLAGVTLAFNQLTVSCVRCHETLRTPNGAVAPHGLGSSHNVVDTDGVAETKTLAERPSPDRSPPHHEDTQDE